jgi:predicted glycoside hydrolase/deacetylase ChbG (UPF0249 family)
MGFDFGKQLVVNADDFGFTPDVNAGIVEAHRQDPDGDHADGQRRCLVDAVRLRHETPTLDIGCHLVIGGGRW